jgi:positive regulator of sigma E activity
MMKRQIEIVMIVPPVLLLLLIGIAQLAPAFAPRFDSRLLFRIFSILWICGALACIIRGFWILKRHQQRGWFSIAVGVFYLLLLAMIQPATT